MVIFKEPKTKAILTQVVYHIALSRFSDLHEEKLTRNEETTAWKTTGQMKFNIYEIHKGAKFQLCSRRNLGTLIKQHFDHAVH